MTASRYTINDLGRALGVAADSPKMRALRIAAEYGAFGPNLAEKRGRRFSQEFGPDAPFAAALFAALHRYAKMEAIEAAQLIASAPGIAEAVTATRAGSRWRFEIQRVLSTPEAYADFAPWAAARSGLPADEPPYMRAAFDLRVIWVALIDEGF